MKLAVKNSLSASLGAVFAISIVFSCSSQQIIAARAVSVRPLFVETSLARATLQCAVLTETDIFTPENGKERAFSECIAQKDTFFNERIRAVPQYAPPPAILQMPPDSIKKAGQAAKDDILHTMKAFVCQKMRVFFKAARRGIDCGGEEQLKANLFLELLPVPNSNVPMITMNVWGLSTELAAKQTDYWELHRVSFQIIEGFAPTTAQLDTPLLDTPQLDTQLQIHGVLGSWPLLGRRLAKLLHS